MLNSLNLSFGMDISKYKFTTLAKAKALRVYAEPLINRAKNDTMNNRRVVFSYLQNKEAIKELFNEIAQKIAERPGGYTRILKTGNRLGDNAKTCFIELVDYNEAMLKDAKKSEAKKTRRSRGKKAAAAEAPAEEKAAE
ncbi:50S ribosomal protein L17 [uncultured Muribaculum sp.]|uniref:50S ribosomal protein L17 n=1 Tax=uncultured Muribaculum sp. TaxID=1918613 RepID=UPI0025B75EF0|nr:50S ribosomal protein L17 [uncultured Muribaculum sp.]